MLLQQSSGGQGQPTSGSVAVGQAATPPSTPTVVLHPQSGVSPSARIPTGGSHYDTLTRLNHRMNGYRSHSSEQEVRYSSVCDSLNSKSLHEAAQLRQQLVSSSAANSGNKSKGSKSSAGTGSRAGNKRSNAEANGNGTGSAATTTASGRANKLPKLTPKSTPSATTPLIQSQQQQQQQLPPASSSPSSACSLPVEFKNNSYSNGSSHCTDSSSNGLVNDVKPGLGSHPNTPSSRLPSTPSTPINAMNPDIKRESLVDHHVHPSLPNGGGGGGSSFDGVVSDELRDLKNVSYPGLENFTSDPKDQFDNNNLLADLDSLSDTDHLEDVDYVKNIMLQIQTTCATPVSGSHFNLHNHHNHLMHHNNHNSSSSHLNHHNNSSHNPHNHMQSHVLAGNGGNSPMTQQQQQQACPPGMSQGSMASTPPPHHHINNNMMNGRIPTIPPQQQQQQHFNGSSGNQSFAVNGGSGDMHAGNGSISAAGNSILNPNIGMQGQQMRPSPMRGTSPIRPPYGHPQQLQQQQQQQQSNVPVQQQQRLQTRPPVHSAGMQSQQQQHQPQPPPQQFNPHVPSVSPGMGSDYPRPGMGSQGHMQMTASSSPAGNASVVYSSRVMPGGPFGDQRIQPPQQQQQQQQQQPGGPVHLMTGPDSYAAGYPSNSGPAGYGQSNGGPEHWNQSQMQQQSHPVLPPNQAMRPQQMPPQVPQQRQQQQQQQQHLQQAQFMQSRAQYNQQQQGPVASAVNMGPLVGHANGFGGQQQQAPQQQQMSMNQVVGNGSVGQQAHTSNLQMLSRQMSAGPEPRPQMHMQRQLSVGAQSMNQQQHAYQGSHGF